MTPLQLGALVAAISNGGTLYYLQHPRSPEEVADFQPRVKRHLDIAPLIPEISYGMAGAVQHGASTLPENAFDHFPRIETAEIHLATNFQNILYEHLPAALKQRIYQWLDVNAKDERKAGDSDEQFYYKTRKKALGPFKRELWDLPTDTKTALAQAYDRTFGFLFEQLRVGGTADIVATTVHPPRQHHRAPAGATAPDDPDAGE